MGLDRNGVRFLLYARSAGADFTDFAMIGRQSLHLTETELGRALSDHGLDAGASMHALHGGGGGYCEPFIHHLGARTIHSYDYSDYEQATHLHDMNVPIPEAFKGRYSLVLDGGSLEHVFNFPVAVKNCMEMVRVGGHFISITPANNFMGHGFYQFSPELFFSILCPRNGFEPPLVLAVENRRNGRWYRAKNPGEIRRRVTFSNSTPTYLMVMAKKVVEEEVFREMPQQSDYVQGWKREPDKRSRLSGTVLSRRLYKPIERRAKKLVRLFVSGFNPRFFEPFDPGRGP